MKIRSNPVGTTMPRADYAETNPKSAAFIKNKPDAAIKKAQDTADQNAKDIKLKAETAIYNGTFSSSGWSGSAPYTQTITVSGVRSTDYPFVDIDLSDVSNASAVIEAWAMVGRCTVSADNKVTAYCYEDKPTVDIPIVFKVVR